MAIVIDRGDVDDFAKKLLDASPMMVKIWDGDMNLIDCNRKVLETFGFETLEEFAAEYYSIMPEFQHCGGNSRQLREETIRNVLAHGHNRTPWVAFLPDGAELNLEIYSELVEFGDRRLVVDFMWDMREIKKAHRELEYANRLNSAIIDSSPVLFTLWDKHNNIVRVGKNAAQFFGIENPDEYVANFFDFSPEYQPCGMLTRDKLRLATDSARRNGSSNLEWLHMKNDGTPFFCDVLTQSVTVDDMNMLIVCTRDITRTKEAQAKEREAIDRVRLMFDAAPLMIQYWEDCHTIIDCNRYGLTFYGCETVEEFRTGMWDRLPSDQPCGTPTNVLWGKFLDDIFKNGAAELPSLREEDLDGNSVYFNVHGVRAKYRGETVAVTYSNDITDAREREKEQRRAEIAEKGNAAKSRFLARISHEIRTPIAAVIGISQIQLKNPALPNEIDESFAHIFRSATVLHKIIDALLDLSKIESGHLELDVEKYEIVSLLSDAVSVCNAYLENDDVKFTLSADANLPINLVGDVVRIGQIISNLMSNAFKYTQHGKVELAVHCEDGYRGRPDEDFTTLVVTVTDTGLGMTQEQVSTIFDEYARFHEEHSYVQGTGLGMAIVSALISLMDAEIKIESEVNVGTTVMVYIPQKKSGAGVIGAEVAEKLHRFETFNQVAARQFNFEPESMPYGKVLVVDDVAANLYVSRGLLEFYDLTIETSESGFDAIEKIRRGKVYDIIFMDYMMPHMDGLETLREIKALGYTAPVVVLTANALIGQSQKFISEGFDDYLSKPIETEFLDAVLNKYIRDKQPPDVLEKAAEERKISPSIAKRVKEFQRNPDLLVKLREDFAAELKNAVSDIHKNLVDGDTKTARLLSHTLKGRAALIHESTLTDMAGAVEKMLISKKIPSDTTISAMRHELVRVISNIETFRAPAAAKPVVAVDKAEALAVLEKLKPMLEQRKSGSRHELGALRDIPEAAILVKQVEKFDFAAAAKSADILRLILE